MAAVTVFYQSCPVCGRMLRIPAKYFGRQMSCTHCEGEFRAGNEQLPPSESAKPSYSEPVIAPLMSAQPQLGEV